MRVIIAGSRTVTEPQVRAALDRCPWAGFISAVVSGGARGADQFGELWANSTGREILLFPAEWKKYGRRAGPIRNRAMAEHADGLIAVWDGSSRGTRDMIESARKLGLRVFVHRPGFALDEGWDATGPIANRWDDAEERAAIQEHAGWLSRRDAELEAGQRAARGAPFATENMQYTDMLAADFIRYRQAAEQPDTPLPPGARFVLITAAGEVRAFVDGDNRDISYDPAQARAIFAAAIQAGRPVKRDLFHRPEERPG